MKSGFCEKHGEIEYKPTTGISVECCPICGRAIVDADGRTIPQQN
jgi:hypothetical protein